MCYLYIVMNNMEDKLNDLLKMAIVAETTGDRKERQIVKMKAGKVVSEMYPAHIMERVKFLRGRKKANNSKFK